MENITLGEVFYALKFIVEFVSIVGTILIGFKKIINKQLEPINKKIIKIDENQCKNFLVNFLADIENGIKKDDEQIKRAYEVYEHYTNELHKNSYIHDKWDKARKEGKL